MRYTTFEGEDLPTANPQHEVGTVGSRKRYIRTMGGFLDVLNTGRSRPDLPHTVRVLGTVTGTQVQIEDTIDRFRALRGTRGTLERMSEGAALSYATAVLEQVETTRTTDLDTAQVMSLRFLVETLWRGDWPNSSTTTLNTSPKAITLENDGNADVEDAVLTITAGSADITNVRVQCSSGSSFTYSGTIAAGKSLVVDAGDWTVLNDGYDAQDDFALDATHTTETWFVLDAKSNTVTVTLTGGSTDSQFSASWYDLWE